MKTRHLLALSLMVGLLLAPLAASAEEHEMGPKPLTWISYVMSKPGKGSALSQHIAEGGAKVYDGLMADGHILSWGVGMPINHNAGDDWNIAEWVTFRDWAAVDAFMQAFMGMQMAKSPEEMMAEQEEWLSLIEPGSHRDEIVRHMVVARADETRPGYFSLSYFPVKPGKGGMLKELWEENAQPTLAKLQEAGTIGSFGLARTEVHDGATPSSFMFWTALPNLAAQDTTDAAFEAVDKERGEEAQKELMEQFASAVDLSGHHDRILMVTHLGGGGGEGGGS
jgi:hypothetical protein